MGHSAVPTHWDPYTTESGNYLEINKKMDGNSMKQNLRTNYLRYWTLTYQALPTVAGEGAAPTPPAEDPEAAPAPPAQDPEAAPVPPTEDSAAAPSPQAQDPESLPAPPTENPEGAQMPAVIGF